MWKMRSGIGRLTLTGTIASVLLVACSEAVGPSSGETREISVLQFLVESAAQRESAGDPHISWDRPPGDGTTTAPSVIVSPDTVSVGEPFVVTVHSIGINSCWSADGQDVSEAGTAIDITPFDRFSGANACAEILSFLPHQVGIVVEQPGEWTIRAHGRRVRASDSSDPEPVVASRTFVAR